MDQTGQVLMLMSAGCIGHVVGFVIMQRSLFNLNLIMRKPVMSVRTPNRCRISFYI